MQSPIFNNLKKISFIILVSISLGKTVEGASMSLFSKEKHEVVVCSPMEGVITYQGEPVADAKVERWLKWKDEDGERDYVFTNNEGRFSLPIVEDTVSLSPLTQFVMYQEIVVIYKEKEYPIWAKSKREVGIYEELKGIPAGFSCELTEEFKRVDGVGRGMFMTLCKWKEIK